MTKKGPNIHVWWAFKLLGYQAKTKSIKYD